MILAVLRRPPFLLDPAGEMDWLNQKAGPEVAERWYKAVCASIDQLRKNPGLGRSRRDLKPDGIRTWRVKGFARWLLFYTERPDALVFLRLRQGSMNLVVLDMRG